MNRLRLRWPVYRKVPLAWAQLSHQKIRLLVALAGIGFANILMFTQLGLRAVLFEGITLVHEELVGDLFILSTFSRALGFRQFPRILLYQAEAVPGVQTTRSLYIAETRAWVSPDQLDPQNPSSLAIDPEKVIVSDDVKILAFNLSRPALNIPEVNAYLGELSQPDTILFDRLSQPAIGAIPELLEQQDEVTTIMDNRRVSIIGDFELGSNFFTKGHVIMSDWNFAQRYGSDRLENVSVGLILLDPDADIEQVQARIIQALPDTVQVLTRAELIEKEIKFWESDPSGIVLNFGAVMGFIVGVIVVYQVLYTDVSEHLPEYATLKAMGYANRTLLMIVLQEAVILAVMGFIPGAVTSAGVYGLLGSLTKLPLTLKPDVVLQVFGLTVLMCGMAGAIAVRKLRNADPADIF